MEVVQVMGNEKEEVMVVWCSGGDMMLIMMTVEGGEGKGHDGRGGGGGW